MTLRLKPIKNEVIVITGASSGIRLVTARMAAKGGARVVLTARNHDAIKQVAEGIIGEGSSGGMATFMAADRTDNSLYAPIVCADHRPEGTRGPLRVCSRVQSVYAGVVAPAAHGSGVSGDRPDAGVMVVATTGK